MNFTLLTANLRGVQISLGQLWTLGVKAQRIVNVCVDYSCPQTHHKGCASFGIFFLLYLQSKINEGKIGSLSVHADAHKNANYIYIHTNHISYDCGQLHRFSNPLSCFI